MPLLVTCWCLSRLIRHCFLGWWTCLLVSRELPFRVETLPVWLKNRYSVLCALTWRLMPEAARSRLCIRDSARTGVFVRSAKSQNNLTLSLFKIKTKYHFLDPLTVFRFIHYSTYFLHPIRFTKFTISFFLRVLILDQAVNQEMHLCK